MSFKFTLDIVRKFVGPFNIINNPKFFEFVNNGEKFYLCRSKINSFTRYSQKPQNLHCFGFSNDKEEAELKSLCESLERYCGVNFTQNNKIYSSWKNLKDKAILPTTCIQYSNNQYIDKKFIYKKFDKDINYTWFKAVECHSLEPVLVHSDLVLMQSNGNLTNASSIGMALHSTHDDAINSALLEYIERDFLSLVFFRIIKCKKIPFSILPFNLIQHVSSIQSFGYDVHCLCLNFDINVHVVLWVGFHKNKPPFFIKGASSSIILKEAIEKSFNEMFRSFLYYKSFEFKILNNVGGVLKNLMYYQTSDVREKLFYLIENDEQIFCLDDVCLNNYSVLERVVDAGFNPIFIDMMPSYLKYTGLHCIRVLVPGLIKTPLGNEPWPLGMQRLFGVSNDENEKQLKIKSFEPHFFS